MAISRKAILTFFIIVAPLLMAGCVGRPPIAPVERAPAARPTPRLIGPPIANWENGVLTAGSWTYAKDGRDGLALYGLAGSDAVLSVRCDTTARRVIISRQGTVAGPITLRATSGVRAYDAKTSASPTAGMTPYIAIDLAPNDPQLDALAFSRGRFLVGVRGAVDVVVPSWPEVARVIEDCRG